MLSHCSREYPDSSSLLAFLSDLNLDPELVHGVQDRAPSLRIPEAPTSAFSSNGALYLPTIHPNFDYFFPLQLVAYNVDSDAGCV